MRLHSCKYSWLWHLTISSVLCTPPLTFVSPCGHTISHRHLIDWLRNYLTCSRWLFWSWNSHSSSPLLCNNNNEYMAIIFIDCVLCLSPTPGFVPITAATRLFHSSFVHHIASAVDRHRKCPSDLSVYLSIYLALTIDFTIIIVINRGSDIPLQYKKVFARAPVTNWGLLSSV